MAGHTESLFSLFPNGWENGGGILFCLSFHADLVLIQNLLVSDFFIDWMVRSTNHVAVCRFGVPYLRIMLYSLQKPLYSFEIEALPLSDLITSSTP